jgi:hemerythrin superfamily protein
MFLNSNKPPREVLKPTGGWPMASKSPKHESAIALLTADHKKVKTLFEEYDSVEDASERKTIAEQVFHELEVHTQIEEDIFYPAVAKNGGEEPQKLVVEARKDHEKVKQLIASLRKLKASDEKYDELFQELMENVEDHVKEEEEELFPIAESELGAKVQDLGAKMQKEKRQLGAHGQA